MVTYTRDGLTLSREMKERYRMYMDTELLESAQPGQIMHIRRDGCCCESIATNLPKLATISSDNALNLFFHLNLSSNFLLLLLKFLIL